MKIKYVYTYFSNNKKNLLFIKKRNIKLAQMIARRMCAQYKGELDEKQKLPKNSLLVPAHPLSIEENKIFNIRNNHQIFGSISKKLYSKKTIFHNPLPNAKYVPIDFPFKFTNFLEKNQFVLPGYSVFNYDDLIKAFEKLNKNYKVRIKNPMNSFGVSQKIISTTAQLDKVIQKIHPNLLKKYGFVLEANLYNSNNKKTFPNSYSGGWDIINGEKYSYIGIQKTANTSTPHKYLGTKIFMTKRDGDLQSIKNVSKEFGDIAYIIHSISNKINYIPNLLCTRFNFDLIEGKFNGGESNIYLTEQSFRIGGATIASLLAINNLDKHPEKKIAIAESFVNYGKEKPGLISKDSKIFFRDTDPDFGDVQVWGRLL